MQMEDDPDFDYDFSDSNEKRYFVRGAFTTAGGKSGARASRIVLQSDETLEDIVVKIVQPSLLTIPGIAWATLLQGWTYRRLQSLQGREVPYYFGIQTIQTPCGESAWILAMVYVRGHTITQYLSTIHDNSDLEHMPIPTDVSQETFFKLKRVSISSLEGVNAIHAYMVTFALEI
ncbi:hypothetical protein PLICRDRAFT_179847 [Plicaturopsis crispa FD-325 SS-3]|uniref:Unplaced genomic scaffold PLICRscaffold_19, whole genome shotgun sequence n=1 Tax=Plicaturopsis crispa FD-325 SS-3 TaxID=944288 RepID=A0A0C9SQZ0_PLICR|nr:hypothetical protein PLICRDRAFT_179847 [Plicaturopsis crispa FD-325 SS-3]